MHWLKRTYKGYDAQVKRWNEIDDVSSGAYIYEENADRYLHRRKQPGEDTSVYAERRQHRVPEMEAPRLVGSLSGRLVLAERDISRTFGTEESALGTTEDPVSVASSLSRQTMTDDKGQSIPWNLAWQNQLELILWKGIRWCLVEGAGGGDAAAIRFLDPSKITNISQNGNVVVVKHIAQKNVSIEEEPKEQVLYTVFELNGWRRFVKTSDGDRDAYTPHPETPSGEYHYYMTIADGQRAAVLGNDLEKERENNIRRVLPIYPIVAPMHHDFGYMLALYTLSIYNLKSRQNSLLLLANTPLNPWIGVDTKHFEKHVESRLRRGETSFALPTGASISYVQASLEPVKAAGDEIERLRREMRTAAYDMLSDSTQRTATEISQRARGSIDAFLTRLSSNWDVAENHALFLLEQAVVPEEPARWGFANVKRKTTFAPLDPDSDRKTFKEFLYGRDTIPTPIEVEVDYLMDTFAEYGRPVDEEEIRKSVIARRVLQGIFTETALETEGALNSNGTG